MPQISTNNQAKCVKDPHYLEKSDKVKGDSEA
jgi:hypothetical protein